MRNSSGNLCHFVPVVRAVRFSEAKLPLDPYVLGAVLGDGCLAVGKCNITLGPEKQGIYKEMKRRGVRFGAENGLTRGILGLRPVFRKLGLQGEKSRTKFIPDVYLYASIQQRLEVLCGLLDTDGESTKKTIHYSSASKALLDGVVFLVQSLGGIARIGKPKTISGWEYWRCSINMPEQYEPFLAHVRKLRDYRNRARKYFPARAIKSVLSVGVAECTCVTVKAKDGLFVTSGCTVTHNSAISLELFRNRRRVGSAKRALVLVPNIVNLGEWENQVERHAYDCTVGSLDGAGEKARRAVLNDAKTEIVVSTYQGMSQLCSMSVPSGNDRNRWMLDGTKTDAVGRMFGMLVLDECAALKNPNSLHFKVVRRMCRQTGYVYGLTGTPFGKDPMDLWSQFYVIDKGYSLGETLGLFREVFFSKKQRFWGGYDYTFRTGMRDVLHRRLAHAAIRYSEAECQDMPPAVGGMSGTLMLVPVSMPKSSRPYYDALKEEMIEAREYDVINNAYARMRMVSSGWLGMRTEEGERVEIVFKQNPKLDAVIDKLRTIPEEEKVVIVHWFHVSGEIIAKRLVSEKIPFIHVYGKTPVGEKKRALARFRCKDGPRVLLASTAISKGVNLQDAARFMIFFETPDSAIDRRQMEARILREGGLKGPRYFYDCITAGTIDVQILKSLQKGKRLLDELIDKKRAPQ